MKTRSSSEMHGNENTPQATNAVDDPDLDDLDAPDVFDPRLETTNTEIYAYYSYYVGLNGIAPFAFAPLALQKLLSRAADDQGNLTFIGRARDINSIVLIVNGASFAFQTLLLLFIGSYADFSAFRSRILIIWSIAGFVVGFAWLGVQTPERWFEAVLLYSFCLTTYQIALTYWTAAFPSLARNLPQLRAAGSALSAHKITRKEYDREDTMQRSRISNTAFFVQSCAAVVFLGISAVIIKATNFQESDAKASRSLSIIMAFYTALWLLFAIPWFVLEKKRPGAPPPEDMGIIRAGLRQLGLAAVNIWSLKQCLLYLFCYFLLGDTLNTAFTLYNTLQNQILDYDSLTVTYMVMLSLASQGAGIYVFWQLQQFWKLSTKTMVSWCIFSAVLFTAWGVIGNWTQAFGFHNVWEIWVWQWFFGFFVCPWYSYGQIMISTLTPRGYESMFFSFFGIVGKTSSLFGPLLSSVIIDFASGPNKDWSPFYLLFVLAMVGGLAFWIFLDEEKSAVEQAAFLERQKELAGADTIEMGRLLTRSSSLDL